MFTFKRRDVAFIFIFICLYLFCFSFQLYSSKQKKYYELSNELYTNHYAVFVTKDDQKWLPTPLSKSSYRVFMEYNQTFRLILENKGDWSPPMISGRFFAETDEGSKAVIGQEMLEYVKEHNGMKYITFKGEDYQVTGVMGASFASSIDYLILLYVPNQTPVTTGMRIILDSDSKSTVKKITHHILDINPSLTVIESIQKGIFRKANIPFFYYLLLLEMSLLLFFSIFAFLRYWFEKEKKYMYVLYLLGISKRIIHRNIFIKTSLNIFIGTLISIILFIVFNSESVLILNQMVWCVILFLSISWILLSSFIWSNNLNSRSGVVKSDIK
ncbi:ABC transporter permease [Paenibacillus eucommiae]|uniref:MacB-like periplasmic core domain-containing protein n=1 Tax=Paenibacillus eucommiae TaxID=1355755 RepID=A0ABS4IWD6_9BACL|nr:ABC transporter permease [Paenibacillus eucommiae]MBP1991911.1 hypothetical protein [Paenibacillus eucommiae]